MKFSVIIPTYNRESIILRAVNSVLRQTFDDYELIVVDNGSIDGTRELVEELSAQDPRVHYHWQENSGSPAGSRNTGIELSKGDWVAFLDSDDSWEPTKLETIQKVLDQNQHLRGIGHSARIVAGERVLSERRVPDAMPPEGTLRFFLKRGNCLTTSATLISREALRMVGPFNPSKNYATVEDFDLWIRVAKEGEFGFLDQILTTLYVEEDQLSRQIDLQQDNLGHMMRNHIRDLDPLQFDQKMLYRLWEGRIEYYKGRLHTQCGDFSRARRNLWNAIRINPSDWRAWVFLMRSLVRI
jgi:teichuronic acid biosynthesis glycosyltransferase TuaG